MRKSKPAKQASAAEVDPTKLASTLQRALSERNRAENSVILSTLALQGQGADFDYRIANELQGHAWPPLAEVYEALHQAMRLIPAEHWPQGYRADEGVSHA